MAREGGGRPSHQCCPPGIAVSAAGAACSSSPCPSGQTAIGPSNFCCPSSQVYANSAGQNACCSGALVNGQCPSSTPLPNPKCQTGVNNPPCCPSGYVASGTSCCLSSQMTSTGVCCPTGQKPTGPNNAQCGILIPILHLEPSCCTAGKIPVGDGSCCLPGNVTTSGVCCSSPVDPNDRTGCPVQIQLVPTCAAGYTRMPDGTCCNNRYVSADRRSCQTGAPPCRPGEFRDLNGVCTPIPPPAGCPSGEVLSRRGACVSAPSRPRGCPPGEVLSRRGICVSAAPPPRGCPRGEVRRRSGECGPIGHRRHYRPSPIKHPPRRLHPRRPRGTLAPRGSIFRHPIGRHSPFGPGGSISGQPTRPGGPPRGSIFRRPGALGPL